MTLQAFTDCLKTWPFREYLKEKDVIEDFDQRLKEQGSLVMDIH